MPRSLLGAPTFTAVALIVLALGIGAGTAIFSVVDAVVLRGLPFDEHDRLAAILEHDTQRPTTFGGGQNHPQTFLDWRRMQESFEAMAGVGSYGVLRMRNEAGEPVDGRGLRVTHEFFPVFRVAPLLGRAFTADDEIDGRHRVAILELRLLAAPLRRRSRRRSASASRSTDRSMRNRRRDAAPLRLSGR